MKIETAHKILIGAAVVFFAFFALLEAARYVSTRSGNAGLLAAGGLVAAAAFGIYLRWYIRSLRAPASAGSEPIVRS